MENIQFKELDIRELKLATYQRPENKKKVDNLVSKWNDRKKHALMVSYRDGQYWVIDGQHRRAALLRVLGENGKNYYTMCEVHYGLNFQEEETLFRTQHANQTRLTQADIINSALVGGDPYNSYVKFNNLCKEYGIKWATKKGGKNKDGVLYCIFDVVKNIDTFGIEPTKYLFTIYKKTPWGKGSIAYLQTYVRAIFNCYTNKVNIKEFITFAREHTPNEINMAVGYTGHEITVEELVGAMKKVGLGNETL